MTVRNVMELVLWSISNPPRGFSLVMALITSHSVSTEYQCHTYPRLQLQHFCVDSFKPQNFFLLLLEKKRVVMEAWCSARENLESKDKVVKCIWKSQRFSLFVGFLMRQVFPLSCWCEIWEISSLLPHLHSYETKDWESNKLFITFPVIWLGTMWFPYPLRYRFNLPWPADSDNLTTGWSWLRVTFKQVISQG